MIEKMSKAEIISAIKTAEEDLQTLIELKVQYGIDGANETLGMLKDRLLQLEASEPKSPKTSVVIQTPNITTKTEAAKPIAPKKEKIVQPTARKAIDQAEFSTSLKLSDMFLKTSDFTFFQENIRLICARFRQFDKLKNKKLKSKTYHTALIGLKNKCLKIIEHSVKLEEDREVIKNTVYSSWIKDKTFTLNDFDKFLKSIGIS